MRDPSEARVAVYEAIEAFLRDKQITVLTTEAASIANIGGGTFEITGDDFAGVLAAASVESAFSTAIQAKYRDGYNRWAQERRGGLLLLPCYERRDGELIRVYGQWSIRPVSAGVPTVLLQSFELRGKAALSDAERVRGTILRAAGQVSPATRAIADITMIGLKALAVSYKGQGRAVQDALYEGNLAALQAAARQMKLADYNYQLALEYGDIGADVAYLDGVNGVATSLLANGPSESESPDPDEAAA